MLDRSAFGKELDRYSQGKCELGNYGAARTISTTLVL
jgi:hypothetical protein